MSLPSSETNRGGGFTANSPRDLLSLHCAACLATRGETILDEAISFTTKSLKSTAPYTGAASLACEIKRALEIPLPRRVRIYEAKSRIAEYGREAEADELVMELAKLNYNLVQLQYQQELKIITRLSYLLPPLEIIGRLAMFLAKLL